VAVPFGRSRRATGYVVGFPTAPPAGVELRDVAEVLDAFPLFTPDLVRLLRWAEDYYLCPAGGAVGKPTTYPVALRLRPKGTATRRPRVTSEDRRLGTR
jgi:primosomal protein N'